MFNSVQKTQKQNCKKAVEVLLGVFFFTSGEG